MKKECTKLRQSEILRRGGFVPSWVSCTLDSRALFSLRGRARLKQRHIEGGKRAVVLGGQQE